MTFENLVRFACVMNDRKDAAGRGGLGAMMGSKNLKVIAAFGRKNPQAADPAKIRELTLICRPMPKTGGSASRSTSRKALW
jgi:aldehyde:ferredoxin oxidoreductase